MRLRLSDMAHRIHFIDAIAKCIAVLLAYLLGAYVTGYIHKDSSLAGSLLTCTSAIVVMQQPGIKNSMQKGWLRILGTFLGASLAYLYLTLFPFSLIGMLVSVFILDLICMFFNIPNDGKMPTITLIVILIVSKESPDLPPCINGILRFCEATVGTLIGIFMVWLLDIRSKRENRKKAATAPQTDTPGISPFARNR